MSDYDETWKAVERSRSELHRIVHNAEKTLEGMEKEMAELQKQLKEQQDIVSRAEELRNAYNRESLKWERSANRALPPGSTYPIKRHIGEYAKNRGTLVERHYPWLATTRTPAPAPAPAPAPEPESETEDLFGDLDDEARPPPAPAKRRKPRIINDDDSSDAEDEVAVTGERSWAERDQALRAKAIALDSCVDEVFRNFNVSIR
jgi:hypothetical protein